MEDCERLLEVNDQIATLSIEQEQDVCDSEIEERLEALRQERANLEWQLGDAVEGLAGYRGGPC